MRTPIKPINWTRDLVTSFWDGLSQTRLSRDLAFAALAGEECIQVFAPFLDRNRLYLDFGGGDGQFAALLCSHGCKVAIYDTSEGRSRHAENLLTGYGERYLGRVSRDTNLRFGGIFLLEVAEHILDEDIAPTYEFINSLLEPGGFLFVTTPNKEDLELGSTFEPQSGAFFHRWQHVRSLDRHSLVQMLKPHGLNKVLIHEVDFRRDVFAAVNESVAKLALPDPFTAMRPVYMGARSNIAAIFCKGETTCKIDNLPYVIPTRVIADLSPANAVGSYINAPATRIPPHAIEHEAGLCFVHRLKIKAPADSEKDPTASVLRLYEDDVALGPPNALHDDIRQLGGGHYSHWNRHIYFSSSNGSDPRTNGRHYEFRLTRIK